jgi:hypothetical protein
MKHLTNTVKDHACWYKQVLQTRWKETDLCEGQIKRIIERIDGVVEQLPKNVFLEQPMRSKGFAHREMALAWAVQAHNFWLLAGKEKKQHSVLKKAAWYPPSERHECALIDNRGVRQNGQILTSIAHSVTNKAPKQNASALLAMLYLPTRQNAHFWDKPYVDSVGRAGDGTPCEVISLLAGRLVGGKTGILDDGK